MTPTNSHHMSNAGSCKRHTGLTLLEMIVTLIVVGLASSLVIQSVFSLVQFDQRLREGHGVGAEQILQRYWLQQVLVSIVPGRKAYDRQFSGKASGFSGWISNPPWPDVSGPLWVEVTVARGDDSLWELTVNSPGLTEWTIASGLQHGQFEYLTKRNGNPLWSSTWNMPSQQEDEFGQLKQAGLSVPRSVRLIGAAPWLDLTVPVSATRNPQLSQQDVMGFQ